MGAEPNQPGRGQEHARKQRVFDDFLHARQIAETEQPQDEIDGYRDGKETDGQADHRADAFIEPAHGPVETVKQGHGRCRSDTDWRIAPLPQSFYGEQFAQRRTVFRA